MKGYEKADKFKEDHGLDKYMKYGLELSRKTTVLVMFAKEKGIDFDTARQIKNKFSLRG